MEQFRKWTIGVLAGTVAAAFAAGYSVGQEPITERAGDETPLSEREEAARPDVAVLGDEQRDVAERVEQATELVERREEIARMADEALARLRAENASAAQLLDRAYGYAVFDTTKGGLIVTGAGGTGVARETESGEETYMHLGAGGIGVGGGFESYKVVMAFEDRETYDAFVAGRWDGSISAQAAAGEEGAAAEEQFVDGIRVYRLTDAGLIAQVDVSGTRFWPSEELNHPQLDEEEGLEAADE